MRFFGGVSWKGMGRQTTVYRLTYHLVLVVKYRGPCITQEMGDFLIREAGRLIAGKDGALIGGNHDKDHIHLLLSLPPNLNLSHFVASLKNTLSRLVKKQFPDDVRKYLWGDAFWSSSFFISSTGGASLDTVRQYIEDQGKPKRPYTKKSDSSPTQN